ncbi:hypothetical protein AB1Y20_012209 [Prymnesium parvum]|uniref:BZIP domain-containing protein n=1 Tax=Prymnesium parvum TaxID=97485 RepID=A0AB34IRG9_PRYPA
MARLAPTSRLAHSYVPVAPLTAAAHALPFAPPIPSYRAPLTPYLPLSSASALSAMSYTGQKNVEGQPHGEGKRSFPSGHVYEGQFVNGLQHGRGTFRFPDGQLFEGEWKAGKRHGHGRLTMSDGQVVEGQWVDDEFKGSTKKPTPHEEPLPVAPSLHLRTRHAPPVDEEDLPPPPLPSASLAHSGRTEPDYKDFDRLKESHALIWQLNVELQAENVRLVKENRRLRRQVKEISSYPPHVESRAAHDQSFATEQGVTSNHELYARREHPQDTEWGEPRRHKPHASRELPADSRRGTSRYHDSYASHEDSSDAEKASRRRARNEKASARLRHRVELERAGFPIEEVAAAESHSLQPYSSKEERHHRAHKSPSKHLASNRDAFHFKKPEPVGDFVGGAENDDWDTHKKKLTRSRSKESSAENRELEPPWSRRRRVVTEMCDTLIVEIEDELWKADWTPVKLLGAHGEVEGFAKRVLNMQLNPLRSQDPGVFIDDLSLSDSLREAMSAKQAVSCWPEGLNRILTVTESDLQSLLAARELRLNDRMLGGGGGGAMALIMRASTALYVCDLSRNNIGDPGAWALAEALRSNSVLGALYLPENNIGVRGGVAIAEAVGGSRTLRVLDLGRNHLEAAGATAIAKVVQKNRSLTELSLFGNSIGIIGGRAIADAVRVNSTLRSLDLRDNGLDKYTETSLLQVGGGVVILEGDAMRGALSNSMLGSESSHGTLPARYPSTAQPHQGPYLPFQQNAPGWNCGPDTRVSYPQHPANNFYGDPYQHSPGKHGHYQPVSFLSWAKSEKPDAGPSQSRSVNETTAPNADSFLSWASKEPQVQPQNLPQPLKLV